MREVAAHPGTGEQGIHGSIDRVAGAWHVVQPGAHPRRHLLQQSRRIDVVAEFGCGEAVELVSLGVAAGAQVHGQIVFGHRRRVGLADDCRRIVDLRLPTGASSLWIRLPCTPLISKPESVDGPVV